MIPFKPTVEPEHEEAFLTEDPRVLAVEGRFHQVPWMLGLNARDGALRSASELFGGYFKENLCKNSIFDYVSVPVHLL